MDEPASREENLAFARGMVARLSGLPALEPVSGGVCDDCERESESRWVIRG